MDSLKTYSECAHNTCGKARFARESPWCAEHHMLSVAQFWPSFDTWRKAMQWSQQQPYTMEQIVQRTRDRLARGARDA